MLKEMKILGRTDSEFDCRVMKWATQGGRCHDLGSMDGLPQENPRYIKLGIEIVKPRTWGMTPSRKSMTGVSTFISPQCKAPLK